MADLGNEPISSDAPEHERVFRFDVDTDLYYGFIKIGPRLPDGSALKSWHADAPPCRLNLPKYKKPLTDLLNAMGVRVLSDRTVKIIANHRVQETIRWIPVDVYAKGEGWIARYFAPTNNQQIPVLNLEHSNFTWLVPNVAMGFITRWVLDGPALPPCDFFEAEPLTWMVTEQLKAEMEKANLTGMKFHECEVHW